MKGSRFSIANVDGTNSQSSFSFKYKCCVVDLVGLKFRKNFYLFWPHCNCKLSIVTFQSRIKVKVSLELCSNFNFRTGSGRIALLPAELYPWIMFSCWNLWFLYVFPKEKGASNSQIYDQCRLEIFAFKFSIFQNR